MSVAMELEHRHLVRKALLWNHKMNAIEFISVVMKVINAELN